MAISTKIINQALKKAGIDAEIVKGDGYYYFFGKDVEHAREQGVYDVCYLNQLTVEQWVSRARDKVVHND